MNAVVFNTSYVNDWHQILAGAKSAFLYRSNVYSFKVMAAPKGNKEYPSKLYGSDNLVALTKRSGLEAVTKPTFACYGQKMFISGSNRLIY